MVEKKQGTVEKSSAREGTTAYQSLQRRYQEDYRTRFRGYEDSSAAMFYSSVLSDGPVAHVDKVVIKAPVSRLPLVPGYWNIFRGTRKGRDGEHYLDPAFRVPGFVVHIGDTKAKQHLYVTRSGVRLRRPILSVFVDGLVMLAENGVLDLGTTKSRRRRAYDLLRLFIINEIELRFDLDRRAGNKLMDLLGEYRDKEGHFVLSCWKHRHVSGRHLKLYDKGDPTVRVEVILYSKFFASEPLSAILSTPRVTFERWWPLALWNIKQVEEFGHKPKLSHLREAIANWVPLVDRVRELEVERIAERMIKEGKKKELF